LISSDLNATPFGDSKQPLTLKENIFSCKSTAKPKISPLFQSLPNGFEPSYHFNFLCPSNPKLNSSSPIPSPKGSSRGA
jgi:hypothetical protein